MSERVCGIYFPRFCSSPEDVTGCILPEGHDGRHVFRSNRAEMIEWEPDWDCKCDACINGEPMDQCCVYTTQGERARS